MPDSSILGTKRLHVAFLFGSGCWVVTSFLAPNALLGHATCSLLSVGLTISAIASAVYLVATSLFPDRHRPRIFASIVGGIVTFNTYGLVFHITISGLGLNFYTAGLVALAGWIVLFLLVVGSLWVFTNTPARERAIYIGIFTLLAASVLELGARSLPRMLDDAKGPIASAGEGHAVVGPELSEDNGTRPNIYYFILDAYSRPDQIMKYTGLNIADFMSELQRMGFLLPTDTRANYLTTNLSLGHTLLGEYYVVDEATHAQYLLGRGPSSAAEGGWSPLVDSFEALGYDFVRAGTCTGRESRCLNPSVTIPTEVFEMLHNTPVMILLRYVWPSLISGATRTAQIPETLKRLADLGRQPILAFVHFLYPHDTTLNRDCSVQETSMDQSMAARTAKDRLSQQTESYRETVICINRQIVEGLKHLMAMPGEKIVVITSDHGTSYSVPKGLEAADWPREALLERSSTLNAWLLPEACRSLVYDGITPINHFRLIAACIRGKEPDFLEDRTYAVSYGDKKVMLVPAGKFVPGMGN